MHGNPASSAAQGGEKTFPPGSSSDIPVTSGLPSPTPQEVGSPVQPDIRQDTPIPDMGMGYREGTEDDAW